MRVWGEEGARGGELHGEIYFAASVDVAVLPEVVQESAELVRAGVEVVEGVDLRRAGCAGLGEHAGRFGGHIEGVGERDERGDGVELVAGVD